MVTFKCNEKDCPNKDIDYNFLGKPENAQCGGCKTILIPNDFRPDPEMPAEII